MGGLEDGFSYKHLMWLNVWEKEVVITALYTVSRMQNIFNLRHEYVWAGLNLHSFVQLREKCEIIAFWNNAYSLFSKLDEWKIFMKDITEKNSGQKTQQ
jgi:hypothetical protein